MMMMASAAKPFSALPIRSMAAQKSIPSATKTVTSKKSTSASVKLLTRVEQLRLLSKAEKAGLLSAAEKSGLSLSTIERLGLLSKAEELGVLSAATDPATASALLNLGLGLLLLGPAFVFLVPEDYPWEIGLQVVVAVVSVVGGSAAFAASNLVSTLQKSVANLKPDDHSSCWSLSSSGRGFIFQSMLLSIFSCSSKSKHTNYTKNDHLLWDNE